MNNINQNTPQCQTLDVKSSAVELGVCEETVRRLVRRKVLPKLPGLRRILIPKAELQRYLAAQGTFR
jgi:excisionase family DNA binding protein